MDGPHDIASSPAATSKDRLKTVTTGFGTKMADWRWLLLLLAIVVPLRGWLLYNTEVPARDSVGYIRYALRFDEHSWSEVLCSFDQHPGYPAAIWLVSLPVRAVADEVTPELMVLCAQLVSAFAAALMVMPAFYLGKALWNAQVGFGAAILFQCLPVTGHHLSDGITESLFILLVTSALMFGGWAIDGLARRHFAMCGVCGGLAYLTRPEGALTVAAAGLVLLGMQLAAKWRRPWHAWAQAAACLAIPAALIGSLYVLPTGRFTRKPAVDSMLPAMATPFVPLGRGGEGHGRILMANLFAVSYPPVDGSAHRLVLSTRALSMELAYSMNYFGLALALVPLLIYRQALFARPAALIASCYCALHMGVLVLLAMSVHYVSDRHVTPLVLLIGYPSVLGLYEIVCSLSSRLLPAKLPAALHGVKLGVVTLLLVVALACLPRTVERLHANRAGNHAAGRWLAVRLQPGDIVDDDHAWSHYYAGQVFLEHDEPPAPPGYHPICYVVMTRSHDPEIAAKRQAKAKRLQRRGHIVYHWPHDHAVDHARVVVYAVPRDPQRHPWKTAPR